MGKPEEDVSPKASKLPQYNESPMDEEGKTLDDAQSDAQSDAEDAQNVDQESDTKQPPLQKRRRVTRACDECRRKKIKCDGKQPCTHCTVYSYDCTYDQPSNRRRNPAPQYIEALEQRLAKSEAIIRAILPGFDISDPKFEGRSAEQILESVNSQNPTHRLGQHPSNGDDDAQMRSMVDRTGSLDLDDTGFYDYHGNSSGYNFVRRFRAQFGDEFLPVPQSVDNRYLTNLQGSPKSFYSSPMDSGMGAQNSDLPPKHVAIELCRNTLDDCCALQRPLHRPTFFARLEAVYRIDPENYTNSHIRFLPSLYAAMAVGCLFGRGNDPENASEKKGYSYGIERGYQYFNVAKSMLDISECRDLVSIQSVMFMIIFLQGTAKLSTCYAYIGVALRACCRLGMHRKITGKFNVIEQEERKRLFWQIRKMDIYVGAMLGLPQMLSNHDIDQDLSSEVFDEAIGPDGFLPTTKVGFPLIRATNAHTKLVRILQKVCRYIYPVKGKNDSPQSAESMISHSLIRELERDLQEWMDELPLELRPSEHADLELARVQQLLRMSYAYVQMMIYRPFLHYVGQACQTVRTDKRSFACAAACVSVSRNVVHITSEMKRRGLLMGAYWFVMYTTYFAILSLLYFVLENPESPTSKEILRDAVEGRETLANLAQRSLAADRCSSSLAGVFEALPEKLNERRSSIRTVPNMGKKRPSPGQDPPFFGGTATATQLAAHPGSAPDNPMPAPNRARTMPQEFIRSANKRMSMPEPPSTTNAAFMYTPEPQYVNMPTSSESGRVAASQASTPAPTLDFGTPAIVHGQLPDLKSVMFPGDNPFAYPNQPMSTLDTMPDLPLGETQDPASQYNNGMVLEPHQVPIRGHFPPGFNQHAHPQGEQRYFDYSTTHAANSSQPLQSHDSMSTQMAPEANDYWSHAPAKGNFRTGLTPGGPGVNLNLDDIFGNAQGWSVPMNLTLPDNTQTSQGMQWSKQNDQDWQGYRI